VLLRLEILSDGQIQAPFDTENSVTAKFLPEQFIAQ
jgi:hypothetical protein